MSPVARRWLRLAFFLGGVLAVPAFWLTQPFVAAAATSGEGERIDAGITRKVKALMHGASGLPALPH